MSGKALAHRLAEILVLLLLGLAGLVWQLGRTWSEFAALLAATTALALLLLRLALAGRMAALALNVAVVLLALVVIELGIKKVGWFQPRPALAVSGDFNREGKERDPDLGYRNRREAREYAVHAETATGVAVYTARYGLTVQGERRTPPGSGQPVWFFGDSFTFGIGLDDVDTLPWQFGLATGLPTRNFGVTGYGPHQALLQLRAALAQGQPSRVIYSLIPDHARRAAGYSPWDADGPWFELDDQGVPQQRGNFGDKWADWPLLRASSVYALLQGRASQPATAQDFARAAGLLAAMAAESAAVGARFDLLLWDIGGPEAALAATPIASALQSRGLSPVRVSGVLDATRFERDPWAWNIPHDGHPSAAANRLLAEALVDD